MNRTLRAPMRRVLTTVVAATSIAMLAACGDTAKLRVADGTGPNPQLPPPVHTLVPTSNVAKAVGWPTGVKPVPAQGLAVAPWAADLEHPRWLYLLPNGDVLVAESNSPPKQGVGGVRDWAARVLMNRAGAGVASANRITLLRDTDGDGIAETRSVFLSGLMSPFGMALVGEDLYVANADALWRFPYRDGETAISAPGTKLVALPAGLNHHWTKNVIASRDGKRLFITVGSNSNVGENGLAIERGRAAIWEYDIATATMSQFASGLRNPNGMGWEPVTGELWTVVNERDELGSDLVPDYATTVRAGDFFGWPYSYYGQNVDQRVSPQNPALVARARAPDYALGPHTASLGLAFGRSGAMPPAFDHGMYVGQHGSWNREPKSGYKVVFVPFANGLPAGPPVDVLAGFLDQKGQAQGRPVGVALDSAGALLVADDVGNMVWRVTQSKP